MDTFSSNSNESFACFCQARASSVRLTKKASAHRKLLKMRRKGECARVVKPLTFIVSASLSVALIILVNSGELLTALAQPPSQAQARTAPVSFGGVSRDLASFCAARPSLPIDLVAMIVHIKKNISFNYKLYLFSAEHVFQTGQVIPRDDFRIHAFPVKFKRLNEFWPTSVPTYKLGSGANTATSSDNVESAPEWLVAAPSSQFSLKQFFSLVPMKPIKSRTNKTSQRQSASNSQRKPRAKAQTTTTLKPPLPELLSEVLPGDPEPVGGGGFVSHDVALVVEARKNAEAAQKKAQVENPNRHIEFDRDDQVSAVVRRLANFLPADYLATRDDLDDSGGGTSEESSSSADRGSASNVAKSAAFRIDENQSTGEFSRDSILPVASFSSFHVNVTYLVRKDFDQREPQLVRIHVDANQFLVTKLVLINSEATASLSASTAQQASGDSFINQPKNEDYDFLSHKLLRDSNTRITAITQIYEDWITRNFYTVVYIQRRLENSNDEREEETIVNDRLIFRGSSTALLGADQLDYSVKAASFITEKNGLHYYFEFLPNGKFYLCAVDWTKRPFKIIDSRRFPIKATQIQLDNEELLLCPPAVCYSNQPVDEIISYGRILLPEKVQREALILSSSLSSPITPSSSITHNLKLKVDSPLLLLNETNLVYTKQPHHSINQRLKERNTGEASNGYESVTESLVKENKTKSDDENSNSISLDSITEAVKAGSGQLQTRLHLRDWLWTIMRNGEASRLSQQSANKLGLANDVSFLSSGATHLGGFEWRYELAKRNDIKVKPDTYGYVLTGHEIDASYRVYNELYLISASHLITINYTMANETVVSHHPISDEFFGLGSTLIDPITGAFYDRYANQIYFFKGDRYVGYDYATKKPLEDFVLQASSNGMLLQDPMRANEPLPLVSTLPVVGILGRQHQVDGIFHDLFTDLVYIFTGMKFYAFEAAEFKNGSFKSESKSQPQMYCINEHFLTGCTFDQAFPNPCRHEEESERSGKLQSANASSKLVEHEDDTTSGANADKRPLLSRTNFNEEQQMKLRTIASTRAGLLNLLVENSLLEKSTRALEPLLNSDDHSQSQEKIVVYLLMAMIVLTALITIVMVVLIINWTRVKLSKHRDQPQENLPTTSIAGAAAADLSTSPSIATGDKSRRSSSRQTAPNNPIAGHMLSAGSNYLNNQRHHHSRRHHQHHHAPSIHSRSRESSVNMVKSLSPVNVVVAKSSRRQSTFDNSAL